MAWSGSATLERQASLEIERARDEQSHRLEFEIAQIKERYSASGLGKGSDVLDAIDSAAAKSLASYASATVDILIELVQEATGHVPLEAEPWIDHMFGMYLPVETVRLWQILQAVAKQVDASSYDAAGRMNDELAKARTDLGIRLGRIRIQQSANTNAAASKLQEPPKPLEGIS